MQNIFCLLTAIDCCCSALFTARVSTKIGVLKMWKTKISVSANIMFPYVQILNVCNKNKSQPNCILPSTMRNSCCLFISRFFFFFKGKKKSLRRKWKRRRDERKNRLLILPIKCGIFDVFVCKLKIHWIARTEWIFARGGWKTRCDFYRFARHITMIIFIGAHWIFIAFIYYQFSFKLLTLMIISATWCFGLVYYLTATHKRRYSKQMIQITVMTNMNIARSTAIGKIRWKYG